MLVCYRSLDRSGTDAPRTGPSLVRRGPLRRPALSKVSHRCGEPRNAAQIACDGRATQPKTDPLQERKTQTLQEGASTPSSTADHGILRPNSIMQPGGPAEPREPPAAPGRDPGHVVRSISNAKEEDPAPRNTWRGRRRAEPVRLLAERGRGGCGCGGDRRRRVVRRPAERL